NLFALAFAPVVAPFTETEVVGKLWEPGFWATDCSPETVKKSGPCWSELNKDRVDGKVWLGACTA
ncbi:MAG: hypothetical protein ACE5FG_15975, partial [Myxococcota bacterium]